MKYNAALVITFCLLGLCGCGANSTGGGGGTENGKIVTGPQGRASDARTDAGESREAEQSEARPVEVKIAVVGLHKMSPQLELNGVVSALPDHMVKVTSALAGKLQKISVSEGDRVSRGQVVAVLIATHLREQLQQADATVQAANTTVQQAEEGVTFARENLERQKSLFQAEVSAKKDIAAAQNQLQVATIQVETTRANLQAARAARKQIESEIELTEIRAPIGGVIANRYLNINDNADLNAPIVQIVGLEAVRVNAALPADAGEQPFVGQTARISSLAAPDHKYTGQVKTISPVVDRATNTIAVQVGCQNTDGRLKEGQNVKVVLAAPQTREIVAVPQTALVPDAEKAGAEMVYLIEGDKVKRVEVKVGYSENGLTQIIEGLRPGQKIVTDGAYGLPDGARVKAAGASLKAGGAGRE